jgi:gamma-glutamyl-gamma-aminobutyrate hydrolase PuuD
MSDRILVVQGASYYRAIDGLGEFTSRVSEFMKNPENFKLVMFTGGADVDPKFYGDTSPMNVCFTNPERDVFEMAIYKKAVKHDILMTGICRGLQFLNVMNGGKMMHHVTGHEGSIHDMATNYGRPIPVNSLHHQMILPPPDAITTGWALKRLSTIYRGQADERIMWEGVEYEAAIFPKTKAFGVQYHPEMMGEHTEGYNYYYQMVELALKMEWKDFIDRYSKRQDNGEHLSLHESNSGPT